MKIASLIGGTLALAMSLSLAGTASAEKGKRKERTPEEKAKFLEKYDTNKDGKLDDAEKAAAKEDMKKNRGEKGKEEKKAE